MSSDHPLLSTLLAWRNKCHDVYLLTLLRGDTARCPPGSLLALRDDGATTGTLPPHRLPAELLHRLRARQMALTRPERVTCPERNHGGTLELMVERLQDDLSLAALHQAIGERSAQVRRLRLRDGAVEIARDGPDFRCDDDWLDRRFTPGWRLLVIGASEVAAHLVHCAAHLDYELLLCEPRRSRRAAWNLGNHAHSVVPDPRPLDAFTSLFADDERTAVLALSGDPALDNETVASALRGRAFFVAALGHGEGDQVVFHGVRRSHGETAVAVLAEVNGARGRCQRALNTSSRP